MPEESVVRLRHSSLGTAFLAPRRIHSAARLDGLLWCWESGAIAGRTSLLSRICERLFHLSPSAAPLIAISLTGPMSHVQHANVLMARAAPQDEQRGEV